uniref:Uncharacterized protein LOC104217062 n=1 Tax=Nicotiana sylvestris TaxID=4096 RepID=A0A1U7VUD3_NICSY
STDQIDLSSKSIDLAERTNNNLDPPEKARNMFV